MHRDLLEEEWYHVRHSGEIPEIALHASIHYLTEDAEGPRIRLGEEELGLLRDAASQRYREIVCRDITPANRGTPGYRGLLRTICNWRRFKRFCQRHDLDDSELRRELAEKLQDFLQLEVERSRGEQSSACFNCTYEELASLAVELDIALPCSEDELRPLCRLQP